jgi:hypothetical protein
LSPGIAGGLALISWMRSARARATRGAPGGSRVTVIAAGVQVIVGQHDFYVAVANTYVLVHNCPTEYKPLPMGCPAFSGQLI